MSAQPLRIIVGTAQILIGLLLAGAGGGVILALTKAQNASTQTWLSLLTLIVVTLLAGAACVVNGARLVRRPRYAPAYWKMLPRLTAVLVFLALFLWFLRLR